MKKNKNNFRGLILPNEIVPNEDDIKRNLLFFDKLDIVSPYTNAVLLDKEVSEEFYELNGTRKATVQWTARGIFPRSENYEEEFNSLNSSISALSNKGLIRVVGNKPFTQQQALLSLTTYASALSQESIVKASIHDYRKDMSTPYACPNQLITPLVNFSMLGFQKSDILENIKVTKPYNLDNVDDSWNLYGKLRIARLIRSLKLCEEHNSYPISTDITNATIIDSIINETGYYKSVQEELADYSLSLELFDINKMNEFLETLNWKEYVKIRKQFRPLICSIRDDIDSQNNLFSRVNESNIKDYIKKIRAIKASYDANVDAWKESLIKLRLGVLINTGATVGGVVTGGAISTIASLPVTLPVVISSILGLGLISLGKLKSELQTASIARSKMTKNKLHIFRDYL